VPWGSPDSGRFTRRLAELAFRIRREKGTPKLTTTPRLTIGLPVYNGEKYVAESIEALLCQSFKDFELIISDNASTDSTGDIARRYEKQDSRVRYFRQPQNVGR
jgi:cellulose synthase/poly-beta-1,6-N-acetylglucosamine synthase-like glycosyltransferase